MATHPFTPGFLALNDTHAPVAAGAGSAELSASAYEAKFTNAVVPKKGFSYTWNGTLVRFYEGVPRDVPPGLKSILQAEGLVN